MEFKEPIKQLLAPSRNEHLQAQWPVRAIVRDLAAAKSIALHDAGVELVQGSFAGIDVIRAAMRDAHDVFSVQRSSSSGSVTNEEEVRFGIAIADLAAGSGVAHLVYSSGASVGEKPTGVARVDAKTRIEAHIHTLSVTATIVKPMIFMDMLARPGFRLDEGQFMFLIRPDQSIQLIAVEDIAKFVTAIYADKMRFGGKTLKIASDTVTGRELEAIFILNLGLQLLTTANFGHSESSAT